MNFLPGSEGQCVIQISELTRIAEILVNLSQFDEAEKLIHRCLNENNLNIDGIMLMARLFEAKQRPDLAERHSQVALLIAEQQGQHSEASAIVEFIETLDLSQDEGTFRSTERARENTASSGVQDSIQRKNWENYHQRIFNLFKKSIQLIIAQHDKNYDLSGYHPISSVFKKAELVRAKFINETQVFNFWPAHIIHCIEAIEIEGSYLEFGVSKGGTINTMADAFPEKTFHGFDSFLGLPEEWLGNEVGYLSLNGETPKVRDNVVLHVGYFDDTLDQFLEENDEKVAFAHIDCDLYSSTKTIFSKIDKRLQKGSVLVFDEFIVDGEAKDEFQAFEEFISETSFSYRFLSTHFHGESVSVLLE